MNVPSDVTRWRGPIFSTLQRTSYAKDLRENLILAVIWQESEGNPWAYNPEPKYKWFWDVKKDAPFRKVSDAEIDAKRPPADFRARRGDPDQEWWAQQASWGLMQVMGAAAREAKFRGDYLPEMCDPYTNIEFGIRHLWNYAFRFGQESTAHALQRWNGGGNPNYHAEVLTRVATIEKIYPETKPAPEPIA